MAEIQLILDELYLVILGIAMAVPRAVGLFFALPALTRLGLPDSMRSMVALVIALPMSITITEQLRTTTGLTAGFLTVLGFKEAFIGLIMGLILGIPFIAMEMAGNILDYQREAPDASLQDPNGTTEASVTGTLFVLFAIVYFVSIDGLNKLFSILYDSYALWPVLEFMPTLKPEMTQTLLELLDKTLRLAFLIALPLVIPMFLSMLVLMIIARFAPQLNVFDLSMASRNLAFFALLPAYALFAVDYFVAQLSGMNSILDILKRYFS